MCQSAAAATSADPTPGHGASACPVCLADSPFRYSYTLDGYDYHTCTNCGVGMDIRAADEP